MRPDPRRYALLVVAAVALAACTAGPSPSPSARPSATTSAPTAMATATLDPRATPTPLPDQPAGPTGPTVEGRVMRIVDGDTIWVRFAGRDWRVRYIGIDSPELGDLVPEPWAREATAANRALVEGQLVVLESDVSDTDRFGRLLRYVWLPIRPPPGPTPTPDDPDATPAPAFLLVNLELVRAGFAQAVSFRPDVRYQEYLRLAEAEARDEERGLWAGP